MNFFLTNSMVFNHLTINVCLFVFNFITLVTISKVRIIPKLVKTIFDNDFCISDIISWFVFSLQFLKSNTEGVWNYKQCMRCEFFIIRGNNLTIVKWILIIFNNNTLKYYYLYNNLSIGGIIPLEFMFFKTTL